MIPPRWPYWLWLSALACGGTEAAPPVVVPILDPTTFEVQVQPMLVRLCAQTACHGADDRAFFLYSPFGARAIRSTDQPALTGAETSANLEACRRQLEASPDLLESPLLKRPLRPEAGGGPHGGGAQFYDRVDPSYVLFACWILGGGAEGEPECRP
ncbi:MAG: hypothetical protein IPG45_14705 [Deltaproteobacteria bacterium]|nr:hypothetical protein [Deltaproteobacteria bacterium]